MIYTCRFCDWQSIYAEKIKEHIEDSHTLFIATITVQESLGMFSIKIEDLLKQNIVVCTDRGFLNPDPIDVLNKCRYCGSRFRNIEGFRNHLTKDHPDQQIDVEVREVGGGYTVTPEELEKKNIKIV
jgi:hypothetical protein